MSGPDYLAMLRAKKLEGVLNSDGAKTEKTSFCTLCSSPQAYSDSTSSDERLGKCRCSNTTSDWWLVYLESSPDPIVITASSPSDESFILATYKGEATKVERTKPQLQKLQKAPTGGDLGRLRSWMAKVGITDPSEIDEMIKSCELDAKERAMILGWADGL
jgi:hypothetical protein